MCFFFFSSRRRHTRCGRDWSSDVCSSDLRWCGPAFRRLTAADGRLLPGQGWPGVHDRRSEERRVGKECRSRWSPYPQKKKLIGQVLSWLTGRARVMGVSTSLCYCFWQSDPNISGAVLHVVFSPASYLFFFKQKTAYELRT